MYRAKFLGRVSEIDKVIVNISKKLKKHIEEQSNYLVIAIYGGVLRRIVELSYEYKFDEDMIYNHIVDLLNKQQIDIDIIGVDLYRFLDGLYADMSHNSLLDNRFSYPSIQKYKDAMAALKISTRIKVNEFVDNLINDFQRDKITILELKYVLYKLKYLMNAYDYLLYQKKSNEIFKVSELSNTEIYREPSSDMNILRVLHKYKWIIDIHVLQGNYDRSHEGLSLYQKMRFPGIIPIANVSTLICFFDNSDIDERLEMKMEENEQVQLLTYDFFNHDNTDIIPVLNYTYDTPMITYPDSIKLEAKSVVYEDIHYRRFRVNTVNYIDIFHLRNLVKLRLNGYRCNEYKLIIKLLKENLGGVKPSKEDLLKEKFSGERKEEYSDREAEYSERKEEYSDREAEYSDREAEYLEREEDYQDVIYNDYLTKLHEDLWKYELDNQDVFRLLSKASKLAIEPGTKISLEFLGSSEAYLEMYLEFIKTPMS